MTSYTVKAGDTLALIAQRALNDLQRWPEIAKINNIKAATTGIAGGLYLIYPGEVLQLPDPAAAIEQSKGGVMPADSSQDGSQSAPSGGSTKKPIVMIALVIVILTIGIMIYKKYGG